MAIIVKALMEVDVEVVVGGFLDASIPRRRTTSMKYRAYSAYPSSHSNGDSTMSKAISMLMYRKDHKIEHGLMRENPSVMQLLMLA